MASFSIFSRNMTYIKYTLLCLTVLCFWPMNGQTFKQRGVVRLITHSATAPMTPVAGVKVIVGNAQSQATGQDGSFSMQVPGNFQVNGVTPSDYVLALPTKGKSYAHSANDLDVVVVDKKQQEHDYKTLYTQLRKKYRQQTDELNELRQQRRDQLESLSESDAQYAATKVRLDSLQTLYVNYINNEEQIQKQIQTIAQELSITDYQTLDSLQRRIYDLKREGQWKSISELLSQVMQGDASAYLHQKLANKDRATEIRKAAEEQESAADRDLASAFQFMEEAIEAFKMQNLRDSVCHYYAILTEAAPDNWEYLVLASRFESGTMANYVKAIEYANKGIQVTTSKFGQNHPNFATAYSELGGTYCLLGKYEEAFKIIQKVLEIRLSTLGEDNLETAQALGNLGTMYTIYGDNNRSMEYFQKSIDIKRKVLGENSLEVALDYYSLGVSYNGLEQYDQAINYFEKALKICSNSTNYHDFFGTMLCYDQLGVTYSHLKQYEKAIIYLNKALDVAIPVFGEKHPNIAKIYNNIGASYLFLGEIEKGDSLLEKVLDIEIDYLGVDHPDVNSTFNSLYQSYSSLLSQAFENQDIDNAIKYIDKLYNLELKCLIPNHIEFALTYSDYGYVFLLKEDLPKSLEYFKKSHQILTLYPDAEVPFAQENLRYIYHLSHTLGLKEDFNHISVSVDVIPDGEASLRGYRGEYTLYEFGPWTIDGNDNLLETNLAMQDQPVSMTFYRDGKVFKEDFPDKIGINFIFKMVEPTEKATLIDNYRKWKNKI